MTEQETLIRKYSAPVPRYTSYPTAPHFHTGIGASQYQDWLKAIPEDEAISLYLHIPYCDTLCWFCGCHTKITRRYGPVSKYLTYLFKEIDLVAAQLTGKKQPVKHIHWGGGSPTILNPADILKLSSYLSEKFTILPDAEFALEIDPRGMTEEDIRALADSGVTRASIGIQDVTVKVQQAINRVQPMDETRWVIDQLRSEGITEINLDLIYGLPHQTEDSIRANVEAVKDLQPSRIALFGYAHVPWMKSHMKMIAEDDLPDTEERMAQAVLASKLLQEIGYCAIGMDHFALPEDKLAQAVTENRLTRNFQGYTDDEAETLIGLGVSAIGVSESGYIQNFADNRSYFRALDAGELPVFKGIATPVHDRLHRTIIQHLMCRYEVDLNAVAQQHHYLDAYQRPNWQNNIVARLFSMADDQLLIIEDDIIKVTEKGRLFIRTICAAFDEYLHTGAGKHSKAI